MAFHEVRFPASLSFGSTGGPERRTEIVTLANGFEERNSLWAHSRRRFDAGVGVRSMDDMARLVSFFEERRGTLHGFRWKDWSDFKSCLPSQAPAYTDEQIAVADGEGRTFQLSKGYGMGAGAYRRPIAKPVEGRVTIGVEGHPLDEERDFEVDWTTGAVTLSAVPVRGAAITAGFEFDVPVRFDTDRIEVSASTFEAGELPSVPVVELRIR